MQYEKVYLTRIKRFSDKLITYVYRDKQPLSAVYSYDSEPIPYENINNLEFKEIKVGEEWGKVWGSAWFKFNGSIPPSFAGKEAVALIDLGSEGCVFQDGSPMYGLTNKVDWMTNAIKNMVPLFNPAQGNENIELLVEAAANGLFGANQKDFRLQQAEIAWIDRKVWKLDFDVRTLLSLAEALPERQPRRQKIIKGLNEICNLWQDGKGIENCLKISSGLLSKKANESSTTAYSIGHAHIDLAWLWHIDETKRKGGRTFSTVLQLMEEYPEYKFGASQPQLYQWMKDKYPLLYDRIKQSVKAGKWECQGAMWVEADMNLTGGESLVRQCLYGKRFFMDEFGVDVNNLWLPDVFGYSAALPQILKKCGVDYFMTQKISWNEFNTFPHHTFNWQGIDGTSILTHFLPTNDYNLANMPNQMIASEERYAQSDISDEFLNLYGIGDGGGGPSREHIELGLRQQDLEGTPKFKFAFASEFFEKISQIPASQLPTWVGELYLELHRGTYTTQARMKMLNRKTELKLRDVEILSVMAGKNVNKELEPIWKDTLLHQFHDILPGSSINRVYKEAHAVLEANLTRLETIQLNLLNNESIDEPHVFMIYNTLNWERQEVITLPISEGIAHDSEGNPLPSAIVDDKLLCLVTIPPMGYETISVHPVVPTSAGNVAPTSGGNVAPTSAGICSVSESSLSNSLIHVQFADDGSISSIYDKELNTELLSSKANLLQMWEDLPNNWEAWDINHYYRETIPEQARLTHRNIIVNAPFYVCLEQHFIVGHSTIKQQISVQSNSKMINIENWVEWREEQKMLRVSAETNILSSEASYEIQYGTIKRSTSLNTSWEQAKFEVPAHRFADISQEDMGLALLNDSKYGYSIHGNIMELNLLRSPNSPDAEADRGTHHFVYAYYPHQGLLNQSDTLQMAHNLNSQPIIHPVVKQKEPSRFSYCEISNHFIKIETMKHAEDGNGIIMRFYESRGSNVTTEFSMPFSWIELFETDLLENNLISISKQTNSVLLKFKPFEIRTFRVVLTPWSSTCLDRLKIN